MPLPVIADVFRVALEWESVYPDSPVNVMHLSCPGGGVSDVVDALEASWQPSMWDEVSGAYVLNKVLITPLDGSSASALATVTTQTGGAGGQIVSEQAQVISLHTDQRGPRGRGRLYLGPITEDNTNHGVLVSAVVNAIAAAWVDFANALIAAPVATALGVASYVHSDWHQVGTITSSVNVGTQVRRLRRTRP
jgi:hypothetical protein